MTYFQETHQDFVRLFRLLRCRTLPGILAGTPWCAEHQVPRLKPGVRVEVGPPQAILPSGSWHFLRIQWRYDAWVNGLASRPDVNSSLAAQPAALWMRDSAPEVFWTTGPASAVCSCAGLSVVCLEARHSVSEPHWPATAEWHNANASAPLLARR